MSLKTHDIGCLVLVGPYCSYAESYVPRRPGELVTYTNNKDSLGIVISMSEDRNVATVLWTIAPYEYATFDPLSNEEDPWIPVRFP